MQCGTESCDTSAELDRTTLQAIKVHDDVLAKRKQKMSYAEIFSVLKERTDLGKIQLGFYAAGIDPHEMKKRNKSMMRELLKHQSIFSVVFAGTAHMVDMGDTEAVQYVRKELKRQQQNPYAILALLS